MLQHRFKGRYKCSVFKSTAKANFISCHWSCGFMPNIWELLKSAIPHKQLRRALQKEGKNNCNNNELLTIAKCPRPLGCRIRIQELPMYIWVNAPNTDALGERVWRGIKRRCEGMLWAISEIKYVLKHAQVFYKTIIDQSSFYLTLLMPFCICSLYNFPEYRQHSTRVQLSIELPFHGPRYIDFKL